MDLLTNNEINIITIRCGYCKVLDWFLEDFSNKIMGYLGDHLKLRIQVEKEGIKSELRLFVKCMPRDPWKSNYIKELTFFKKEYAMLSQLFLNFENQPGLGKWRPSLIYIREDLFVFEDVTETGYIMPSNVKTLSFKQLTATVEALARFHAQSFIYEEIKSKKLNRPYRIWEDFSDYLQEPDKDGGWRIIGRNSIIDFLKVHSKYKNKPNLIQDLERILPLLFDKAVNLMKPSPIYRNVVVHRDIWSNNIFLRKIETTNYHALIVDFQTVLYASPMIDLSSLIYFNTTKDFRKNNTADLINVYYETLVTELRSVKLDINNIFDKAFLTKSYEESILFGITQAAIIVPIIAISSEKREKIFSNPESSRKFSVVSRSYDFLKSAEEDEHYRDRISELFDEIVERYIYPEIYC
ncbi:uncharacterized protein LOC113520677 [Galleria mellonella]|uniref:Uncharacterized protein LOC113520677 n=1 Tax=Galleria mellonella TaxID=7137 RepID=A0A6J1WYL4_GALME|nr:uncharacterized protein LOC113520677 [Galleria mellonella]